MIFVIHFLKYDLLPSPGRDMSFILYHYSLIDSRFIGRPEEKSKQQLMKIKVGVSGPLEASWINNGLSSSNLHKILFEYGKRFVIEKLKDGTLKAFEELELLTTNVPIPCEFEPIRIHDPINFIEEVKIPERKLIDEISDMTFQSNKEINIAMDIIYMRDAINTIFVHKFGETLFFLNQERSLMDLFRSAETYDELSNRISSLAALIQCINKDLLKKSVVEEKNETGSINLFEKFCSKNSIAIKDTIIVFRNFISIRKMYPVHGDNVKDVMRAFKFFEIQYPIIDFSKTWNNLKLAYLNSLKTMLNEIKNLYKV